MLSRTTECMFSLFSVAAAGIEHEQSTAVCAESFFAHTIALDDKS